MELQSPCDLISVSVWLFAPNQSAMRPTVEEIMDKYQSICWKPEENCKMKVNFKLLKGIILVSCKKDRL